MSAILAAWQEIPGGWDLLAAHHREVQNAGPNSGLGHGGIIPYGLGFTGDYLAKRFLVQKGRTYLLGVVARVSVWSTLTDNRGRKLPLIEDGSFRVWGNVGFYLPKIEVHTRRVYIP
jgi:hypothetical protein